MNIHDAFQEFHKQTETWINSKEQFPQDSYWHSINAIVVAASESAEPHQHEPSAQLIRYWVKILPEIEVGQIRQPTQDLLIKLAYLEQAQPQDKPPTETPTDLADQGLNDRQISKLMGWNEARTRQFRLALKAKRANEPYNPEHLNRPETTPEERERIQTAEATKKDYLRSVSELTQFIEDRGETQTTDDQWTPPPETVEELHAQGCTLQQIAKIHRKPESEIYAILHGGHTATAELPAEAIAKDVVAAAKGNPKLSHQELSQMFGLPISEIKAILKPMK